LALLFQVGRGFSAAIITIEVRDISAVSNIVSIVFRAGETDKPTPRRLGENKQVFVDLLQLQFGRRPNHVVAGSYQTKV
jgi:hypothetical protein